MPACLDAIAAQTVRPDEVIVVNNNSSDETAEIARSYPFVTVLREPRQGIVYARNCGFNAVSCDIIGRIDADTILPPNWVEKVKQFYGHPKNVSRALTGGGYFYNIRLPRFNGWLQGQLAYRANRFVIGYYVLWGSNMALPRDLWRAVRARTCQRTDIHEDLDLAMHLHELGYAITYWETLRVGVFLKRVTSERGRLHEHMRQWPRTLRVHHFKLWWMGVLGNILLWYAVQPFFFLAEVLARLGGRKSIT